MPLDFTSDPDGFLADPRAVVLRAVAEAVAPPPPCDLNAWARDYLKFPDGDVMPGNYRSDLFPMWRTVFTVLSPDDATVEVTLRGSAQIGKTMVLNVFIAASFASDPVDMLKVDPTAAAVTEWKRSKFDRLRRTVPAVRAVFGADRTRDSGDSSARIETLDGLASLRLVSSQSAAELSGTTRPRVVMDDLSKFENTPQGDPETLTVSRTLSAPSAKILRASVSGIKGACRITRAFERGTQCHYEGPCPHCETMQALEWAKMEPNLREGDPSSAVFTCDACGCDIEENHRAEFVTHGEWVARNPGGDHPSFHIWRVYFPLGRGWGEIVAAWFSAKGDPTAEHTFFNDWLGLPYAQASTAPKWEKIRDRVEHADDGYDLGTMPTGHPLLCVGVDCQGDRTEATFWAFGRDVRRAAIDHVVIPHHIATDEARAMLDDLVKSKRRNTAGRAIAVDRLAIDGGAYTDAVWAWAKRWPSTRVVVVKGANTDTGPIYRPMQFETKRDGRKKRRSKQGFMVNVSAIKASLYALLTQTDPTARGHVSFPRGLGNDFYEQLTSEHRIATRGAGGVEKWKWEKIDKTKANEALDTAVYADVAARLEGWRAMTDDRWDMIEAERETRLAGDQDDLFTSSVEPVAVIATVAAPVATPRPRRASDFA